MNTHKVTIFLSDNYGAGINFETDKPDRVVSELNRALNTYWSLRCFLDAFL